MRLQRLRHSIDDVGKDVVITHVVNQIELGGEFTVCGRAIPDSTLRDNGWEAVGLEYDGTIRQCDCYRCKVIIEYFRTLR